MSRPRVAYETPLHEVTVTRIIRGKGVPWYKASCDDYDCIGHEGIGLEYREQRGRWTGKIYRMKGWSIREATQHIETYHEGALLRTPQD